MPDNRIPTNQSLINIKESIDLLTANINRTADNIAYDSNLTIKGKIQEIDLTSGGNITGDLYIDDESGTTSTEGTTYLSVGNDKATGTDKNSTGILRLYGDSGKCAFLYPQSQMSANRWIALPDKAGTLALNEDFNINFTNTRFFLARPQGLATIEAPIPFSGRKPSSVTVSNVRYYSGSNWVNLTVESTSIMDNCIVMECTAPSGFEQGKVYWGQAKIVATYS